MRPARVRSRRRASFAGEPSSGTANRDSVTRSCGADSSATTHTYEPCSWPVAKTSMPPLAALGSAVGAGDAVGTGVVTRGVAVADDDGTATGAAVHESS